MATRTITGTLPNAPRQAVRFRLLAAFVTSSATYVSGTHSAACSALGAFSIDLPVPDTGTAPYRVELPDGTAAQLSLGAGSATTLELLLAGAFAVSSNPDYLLLLQSLVDTHAAVKASTTVLGHVKVDGTTITINGSGVISSSGGGGAGVTDGDKGDVTVSSSGTVWTVDALPESRITSLVSDLAAKAPLASPTFTGTPAAPTASAGTITTQLATTAFAQQATNAVNVLSYGAIGDGTTDDTLALRAAITAAGTNSTLLFPTGKTFLLSGCISPLSGQTWMAYGATLKRRNVLSTTTATNIGTGTNPTTIVLASATGFAVGMDVTVFNGSTREVQNHRILTIVGNTITVDTNFITALPSGGTVLTSFAQIDTQRSGGDPTRFNLFGMTFDGNRANNTTLQRWENHQEFYVGGTDIHIRDCYAHDAQSEGCVLYGTNVTIEDCRFLDCAGNGIHLGATCNQAQVKNNWLKNTNLTTGTGHEDGAITLSNSIYYTLIDGNYVENALGGVAGIGNGNDHLTISNNQFINCTYPVHADVDTGTTVDNITIVGNRAVGKSDGTSIFRLNLVGTPTSTTGPNKLTVSGNILVNCKMYLHGARNVSAIGNSIEVTLTSIEEVFDISSCFGISVSGNAITGGRYGFSIGGSTNRGIVVKNNVLKNQRGKSIYYWQTGTAIDFSNNLIQLDTGTTSVDSDWAGIQCDSNGATVSGNMIDCQINTAGYYGIRCSPGGASTTGTIVINNTVRSGSNVPSIRTPSGSQKNLIMNNFIQQAIEDNGSPNNTVSGNTTVL